MPCSKVSTEGRGKNRPSHLAHGFTRSSTDSQSRNPRHSSAMPAVSLNRIGQISPKSEHDIGTSLCFRGPPRRSHLRAAPLGAEQQRLSRSVPAGPGRSGCPGADRLLGSQQAVDETTEAVRLSDQLLRYLDATLAAERQNPLRLLVLCIRRSQRCSW